MKWIKNHNSGYATNSCHSSKSSGGEGEGGHECLVPLLQSYKNKIEKMATESDRPDFMLHGRYQLHWFHQIRHVQQKST